MRERPVPEAGTRNESRQCGSRPGRDDADRGHQRPCAQRDRTRHAHCEIVFDRHSHSLSQLDDLRRYLGSSCLLPKFAAVTAVDSRYVESIQVADLAVRMWRRRRLDADPRYAALDLGFIGEHDLTGDADGSSPQLNP